MSSFLYRVQYLHKTYIVFHFNDNIHSAVKLNLIELEITGNHFCSHLYLFSVYEFCVSDDSLIIRLLQYLSQREISFSQYLYNIQKVLTVRFRRKENDTNILQITKTVAKEMIEFQMFPLLF